MNVDDLKRALQREPGVAETLRANEEALARSVAEISAWQAERDAAPLVTQDAVIELNRRVARLTEVVASELTGAVLALARSSERADRRMTGLTVVIAVLTALGLVALLLHL